MHHIHKVQENKNQAAADRIGQQRNVVAQPASFVDNRPSMLAQRKIQESAVNNAIVQLRKITATVTGLTHLVQKKGRSIFEGEEADEVTEGTQLELDSNDKIRSRRGPNQETNRATDLSGAAVYRWVRVLSINNKPASPNLYIRDDAVTTEEERPFGPRDAVISPEQRQRDGSMQSQNVLLIGAFHDSDYDKSGDVPAKALQNADLILEHPTHAGREKFREDASVSNSDKTQKGLLDKARLPGQNTRVLGADGRKMMDSGGDIHAISIKFKPHFFDIADNIKPEKINALATQFISLCLGLERGDIATIIDQIDGLGQYRKGVKRAGFPDVPNLPEVLKNDYKRVFTITKYFKPEVKSAIATRVIEQYRIDCQNEMDGIEGSIKQLQGVKGLSDEKRQQFLADIYTGANDEIIGHLRNAISNLTLLAEALASNKANLIVAFGGEHIPPLEKVMHDVHGVHKNYSVSKL